MINTTSIHTSPAAQLTGKLLKDVWQVNERISPDSTTGGGFSYGYFVKHIVNKTEGFLKALDFSSARLSTDTMLELNSLTDAYIFERNLLARCRGMDRVVHSIDDGQVQIANGLENLVSYLIFERAEGDVRIQMDRLEEVDTAWAFRSMHHTAVGLMQLHAASIAHQDLKPSNILVFNSGDSKIADLGCASDRGDISQNGDVRGDVSYAPLELHYGFQYTDWELRRAGDLYLLGSMAVFYMTRFSMTNLVWNSMDVEFTPGRWNGPYQEVLQYLRPTFVNAIQVIESHIPELYRKELTQIIKELCELDPYERGEVVRRVSASRYALNGYVTKFDRLARKAEARFLID